LLQTDRYASDLLDWYNHLFESGGTGTGGHMGPTPKHQPRQPMGL
jgi:hypothetical protein